MNNRLTDIIFWSSIVTAFFAIVGISPEVLTSWKALSDTLISFSSNPYQLFLFIVTVLGIWNNPTKDFNGIADFKKK